MTIDSLTRAYFQTNKYSDTLKLKYGYVVSNETVTQNRLFNKELIPYLNIPEVTTTITNTVEEKKRNMVLFGVRAGQDFSYNLYGGVALKLRLKSDVEFGVNYNLSAGGLTSKGIEFDVPIKLKKRK
jgi:hypothetical protein